MNIREEMRKIVLDEKQFHQVMALCYEYALSELQDLGIKLGIKKEEKEKVK